MRIRIEVYKNGKLWETCFRVQKLHSKKLWCLSKKIQELSLKARNRKLKAIERFEYVQAFKRLYESFIKLNWFIIKFMGWSTKLDAIEK